MSMALVCWSALTFAVYAFCRWLFARTHFPLLHPGLTSILAMVAILHVTGHTFEAYYWKETSWINWLLGPAVVAMAVPIYQLRRVVRANLRVLAIVVPAGLGVAASSTMLLLWSIGLPKPQIVAGALKSVTSPVAYRLAVDAGVPVDAVMAGVLIAGMSGATLGPAILRALGVRDARAVGIALGCGSHGIGVARAVEMGEAAGAFASLGMSGTAMTAAIVLPFALRWMMG
jgi:putative effector of murein hydrolase